jgi:hypothetical protein
MYTVDIAPSLRRLASDSSCLDVIVGDTSISVKFLNGSADWPIPVLGTGGKWLLAIVGRESPASALVESSAWSQIASNVINFTIDTTQVISWLHNRRNAEIFLEVAKSDPANNDIQTLARWPVTIFHQGSS